MKSDAQVRQEFVAAFGEKEAQTMESACAYHMNDRALVAREVKQPFKHAIVICIGSECFTAQGYAKWHGFEAPGDVIKQWVKDHAELDTYKGDMDYLALFAGAYNEYMPKKAEGDGNDAA